MKKDCPIFPENVTQLKTEREVQIGIATLAFPAGFNITSANMLWRATRSGLARAELPTDKHFFFFRTNYCTQVLTVNRGDSAKAITAVKQTLSELDLMSTSFLAVHSADGVWVCLHGMNGHKTINFDAFLRASEIDACQQEVKKSQADAEALIEKLKEIVKPFLKKPESHPPPASG